MPTGINATIVSLTNGTTANAPDVMSSLNSLNSNGVSNDSGNITTNGSGILSLPGLSVNPTAVTVSGSVSGTATLYQTMTGAVKRVLVFYNNYKSAATQSLTLPVAFTGPSFWQVYDLQGGKIEGFLSGSAQTFSVLTALGIAGGSQGPSTSMPNYSIGQLRTGFDTFKITITSNAASGIVIIEGV